MGGSTGIAPPTTPRLDALLARRPVSHIRWGLDRTRRMLAALGDPQGSFRSLHVAGTNGKGSVAAATESVLREAGYRTGLYTSPHLVEFRERIRVAGGLAAAELVEECAERVLPLAEAEEASFFEAATVLAFLVFERAGVEVASVEVGLGGRLDATNVLWPEACAITSIAYDHAEYLGETLEEIAGEKAGILKAGIPAVVGPLPQRPLERVREAAARAGAPLRILGRDAAVEAVRIEPERGGTRFLYRSEQGGGERSLRVPLVGAHQAVNAGVALLLLESSGLLEGREEAIESGLAKIEWAGRFQVADAPGATWVLDIAHNTAGAEALAETLRAYPLPEPVVLLVAILGDKPWRQMLDPLLRCGDAGVFTLAPSSPPERRWDPSRARRAVRGHRVEVERDFAAALARARELAGEGTVVVTGSCHTVGDALVELERSGRRKAPRSPDHAD